MSARRTGDPVAFEEMARRSGYGSPAWERLNELVQVEVARQTGSPSASAEPGSRSSGEDRTS